MKTWNKKKIVLSNNLKKGRWKLQNVSRLKNNVSIISITVSSVYSPQKKVTKSMFYLQLEAMYAHFSCSMQCCKHSAQLYVNQRNR